MTERHPAEDAFGAPSRGRQNAAVAFRQARRIMFTREGWKTAPFGARAPLAAASATVPGLLALGLALARGHVTHGTWDAVTASLCAMVGAVGVEAWRAERAKRADP
jgi:hypothetical protein